MTAVAAGSALAIRDSGRLDRLHPRAGAMLQIANAEPAARWGVANSRFENRNRNIRPDVASRFVCRFEDSALYRDHIQPFRSRRSTDLRASE